MNNGKNCKKYTLVDVGRVYLDHLLACGKYDEAGKLCLKILGKDKKLWEEEVGIIFFFKLFILFIILLTFCIFFYRYINLQEFISCDLFLLIFQEVM